MSKPRKEKFTPGPWRRGQDGNLRIYGPDGRGEHSGPLAEILPKNGFQTANAAVIAAAPDLYRELFRALAVITTPQSFDIEGVREDIFKVLEAARGESR